MVDGLVLYLVSKGATLCVQSVCILRKVGDSTAQRRLFSASQPVSLCAFIALSLSLARPLALFLSLLPTRLSPPLCFTPHRVAQLSVYPAS